LCGGAPRSATSTPPDSNDGNNGDNTNGGPGNPTPTTNPNDDDASEQDARNEAINDLSSVDESLTEDKIEEHIEANLELAKKVMSGVAGANYELSPREKIMIYQGISGYAKQEGRTGEDIKATTKALKETPVEAILPIVGPPVEVSPLDVAQLQTDEFNLSFMSPRLAGAGGPSGVTVPRGPGSGAVAIGLLVAMGGIELWRVIQQSDNGDDSDIASPSLPAMADTKGTPGPDCPPGIDCSEESHEPKRDLNDPNSLTGAKPSEVETLIPSSWNKLPLKDGNGVRYLNPAKTGESIQINNGYPSKTWGDLIHQGPYVKISINGQTVRIPLAGNPALPK
jgi:hypothetical protein